MLVCLNSRLASATCLLKTGLETCFLAQNLDRLPDRDFLVRISDSKADQVFNAEIGFETEPQTCSQAGQGTLFCLKRLS